MAEDWITADEAAKLAGYTRIYLYELLETGRIKAQKFGPAWQVSRSSLLDYVHKAERMGKKRGPKPKGRSA